MKQMKMKTCRVRRNRQREQMRMRVTPSSPIPTQMHFDLLHHQARPVLYLAPIAISNQETTIAKGTFRSLPEAMMAEVEPRGLFWATRRITFEIGRISEGELSKVRPRRLIISAR